MSSPYRPEPGDSHGSSQTLTFKSVISWVFLALAAVVILVQLKIEWGPASNPAAAAGQLVMSWALGLAASLCALLGALSSWLEIRGPRGPRATLALSSALFGFGFLEALLCLAAMLFDLFR